MINVIGHENVGDGKNQLEAPKSTKLRGNLSQLNCLLIVKNRCICKMLFFCKINIGFEGDLFLV